MTESESWRNALQGAGNNETYLNIPNFQSFSIPRKPVARHAVRSGTICSPVEHDALEYESLTFDHVSQESKPTSASHLPIWLRDWWLETLCCVLFVGALLAIVGAILPYQDRPLPQWPYSISINTVVSILIAISKSAMLLVIAEGLNQLKWTWFRRKRPLEHLARYDMASRGPWGSLSLLLTLRGRDLISSVGAMVTIAAIAMDPFAQQVVRYYSCTVWESSEKVTLPRTNSYSEIGAQIYPGINSLPLGLQSDINAGLFNPGTVKVAFECLTGNCTFSQPYHTLAFCSSCVDSTPDLKITVMDSSNASYTDVAYTYSLPSGFSSYAELNDGLSTSSAIPTLFVVRRDPMNVQNIELILNPWPQFEYMYDSFTSDECVASRNTSFGCNGVGAATCQLFPCIKTYTAVVQDGAMSETLVAKWDFNQEWASEALNIPCLDSAAREALLERGLALPAGAEFVTYNTSMEYGTLADITAIVNGQCIYTFLDSTLNSISYWWLTYFNGHVTQPQPQTAADEPQASSDVAEMLYDTITNQTTGGISGQPYSFNNLSYLFESLADAMTVHIRENGAANYSTPVTGHIGRENTCVHVYWGWLGFPFALVGITILFFIVMVSQTGRGQDRFHDWKSSPLALIYHGLDQDTLGHHDGSGLACMRDMVEHAKDLQVRLSRTEKGWKLTKME